MSIAVTALLTSITVLYGVGLKREKVCTSKACIRAANTILSNMDLRSDPCVNFHEFSCGSFVKTKRIPDEQGKIDVFDILRIELLQSVSGKYF
jgi:membrane metallo-endopeptidase-like protein 1